jgi:hypothetical protein
VRWERPPVVLGDGNALAILGRCERAWRHAGLPADEWASIFAEATSGDYEHLLATVHRHFDVSLEEGP